MKNEIQSGTILISKPFMEDKRFEKLHLNYIQLLISREKGLSHVCVSNPVIF